MAVELELNSAGVARFKTPLLAIAFDDHPDGKASVTVVAPGVTLGSGPHSLFHPEGTALVIHEKADDYMTDPAGNAGTRIACGVVQK